MAVWIERKQRHGQQHKLSRTDMIGLAPTEVLRSISIPKIKIRLFSKSNTVTCLKGLFRRYSVQSLKVVLLPTFYKKAGVYAASAVPRSSERQRFDGWMSQWEQVISVRMGFDLVCTAVSVAMNCSNPYVFCVLWLNFPCIIQDMKVLLRQLRFSVEERKPSYQTPMK